MQPEQLLVHALSGDWQGVLGAHVADFAASAEQERFCAESEADWQAAQADLEAVLGRGDLGGFLAGLFGGLEQALVIYPNLLYPGRQALPVCVTGAIVLSQPLPAAWGDSPPWRYAERPDEVLGALAQALARLLFEQAHAPGRPALAQAAAVLFLRRTEGADAANQFMLMEQRARQLPNLPAFVEALAAGKTLDRHGREEREG